MAIGPISTGHAASPPRIANDAMLAGSAAPQRQVVATRRRIPELDALRGFVAMIVVIHHLFVIFQTVWTRYIPVPAYRVFDFVQAQNKLAVLTFFVLSGYAIGMATRDRQPVTRAAIRHYAFRRVARIVPLYAFSLAWTAALGLIYGFEGPAFSMRTLLGNALFLQTSLDAKGNWFAPFGRNGPYWSLSYEVFFYLLLPVALLAVRPVPIAELGQKGQLLAFGAIAVLVGLVMNQVAPSPFSNFLGLWIVWLVGFVAVDLKRSGRALALVAAPVILTGVAMVALRETGRASATLDDAFSGTAIAFVFTLAAMWGRWDDFTAVRCVRRAFVAAFGRIGKGSYALYLLHYPLLLAAQALLLAAQALLGKGTTDMLGMIGLSALLPLLILVFCPWIERETGAILHRLAKTRSDAILPIEHRGPLS